MTDPAPAVWFPTIRAHSGADVFTQRLCDALNHNGIRAEITWLPLRAEYAPWTVPVPKPPAWVNVVHVNSWLHPRFLPKTLPIVGTVHLCVHDPTLESFKTPLQRLYHSLYIRRIEARTIRRAPVITAVSGYSAERTRQVFGFQHIKVIHNGVDTELFHPLTRSRPNTPFRLLYVGNWVDRKGVHLISPLLRKLGPDFELDYTADRNSMHLRYDLPDNCHCLGRLDNTDLVHAYQQADALFFPSRLEGLPLTVIEAMACGLPVIAANTSSLPEVVADGVTGLLCERDNIEAFANAARHLQSNPEVWRDMRASARKRAVERFDEDRQVRAFLNVYSRILVRQDG